MNGTMHSPRILLIDDHSLVRAGIKSLIDKLDGFTVVGEAASIAEAMSLLDTTKPDIVVTDISIGSDNGLDLLRKVRQRSTQIKLIILSMHLSEALVTEALKLSASAYLLKDAAPEELGMALTAVWRGESFLSPVVSSKMIRRLVQPQDANTHPLQLLTSRQIEILTLLASGKGTKEIAFELDLSDKTVAAHRAQIMDRLKINDLVGLVLFAVRHKLVQV